MNVSEYIASWLIDNDLNTSFCVSGGAIMSLTDSLSKNSEIKIYYNQHEQAAVMAAEGWARITGLTGTCFLTIGPGATNGITGLVGAWMDSVPLIIFSGQSFQNQTISGTRKRQEGIQEANILKMIESVTKLAIKLNHNKNIKKQLDNALFIANSGRKGPVWVEVGADTQRAFAKISESRWSSKLDTFNNLAKRIRNLSYRKRIKRKLIRNIEKSKRPILLIGAGVENRDIGLVKDFLDHTKIPVMLTHNSLDKIEFSHECNVGFPGIFGNRYANLILQSCDLLISVGSRLTYAQTGYNYNDFARNATKIVVDIDKNELSKKNISIDFKIKLDSFNFLKTLLEVQNNFKKVDSKWILRAQQVKSDFASVKENHVIENDYVNSYVFIDKLSNYLINGVNLNTDMGLSYQSTYQGIRLKKGNRLITNTGFASMGWGIASAIGICLGSEKSQTICLTGDGGLMMNIQELASIKSNQLPIKIFVYNNKGYLTMKQSQEIGFDNHFTGVDENSGLYFPDWKKISAAFDLDYIKIMNNSEICSKLDEIFQVKTPTLIDLNMTLTQPQIPRAISTTRNSLGFTQSLLENPFPFIDDNELLNVTKFLNGD